MKAYLLSRIRTLISFPKQNGAVLISVIASMVSVLMIMAVGNGMANSIANQLKPSVNHKLEIMYVSDNNYKLSSEDIDIIKNVNGVKNVSLVSSTNSTSITSIFGNRKINITLSSKDKFKHLKMVGNSKELTDNRVWINRDANWLQPNEKRNLLNKSIFIENKQYKITGIYETNLLDGGNLPDIIINTNEFRNMGFKLDNDELKVDFSLPRNETIVKFETNLLNKLSQQTAAGQMGNFTVEDETLLSSSMHKLVKRISTFIVFISSMSLIVSGLSILNNSYANIAIRSPEIALRRVLGASRSSIRNQFLVESMILLLFGIFVGTILTEIIIFILGMFNVKTSLSILQILIVGFIPLTIGMLSSVGPANLAASKNISELLRTEYN